MSYSISAAGAVKPSRETGLAIQRNSSEECLAVWALRAARACSQCSTAALCCGPPLARRVLTARHGPAGAGAQPVYGHHVSRMRQLADADSGGALLTGSFATCDEFPAPSRTGRITPQTTVRSPYVDCVLLRRFVALMPRLIQTPATCAACGVISTNPPFHAALVCGARRLSRCRPSSAAP